MEVSENELTSEQYETLRAASLRWDLLYSPNVTHLIDCGLLMFQNDKYFITGLGKIMLEHNK